MVDTAAQVKASPELLEVMRQGERDKQWLQENPGVLAPYRGEWVVIYRRRVVAHSGETPDVARAAPADKYPGALLLYVPTEEEARAVHI
jgi:hypothetical protein